MTDRLDFSEKSAEFYSGLNSAQLIGKEEFQVSEHFVGLRITHESAFSARAAQLLDATDKAVSVSNNELMNDITREELSRTLSGIESRMDGRIERIEQSEARRADEYRKEMALRDAQLRREIDLRHDSFRCEQVVRDKAMDERFSGFLAAQAERDKRIDGSLALLSETQKEIKGSIGSMKATIIMTAISTVLTIIIGIVGFNAMLTSNMVSAFQMGRSEQAYQKTIPPAAQPSHPGSP